MRHFFALTAACSGLALATTLLMPSQAATVTKNNTETQMVSFGLKSTAVPSSQTKVVCSHNRPLAFNNEGVNVASGIAPQSTDLAPNIIKLFCRDVRINTIVVRDYCALIRQ
jgi:hypothetical protein